MKPQTQELRWGVERRLEFIEFHLFWEGGVNRADITDFFGVSVPQASKDLSRYQEIASGNIRYDRSKKRYLASAAFKPVFFKPDADRYLAYLQSIFQGLQAPEETWLSQIPEFEALPLPRRNIDPEILRAVLGSIRDEAAIEVKYQSLSLSRPKPAWRWITPHALGFDGMRWHARAFCHLSRRFKDFLLPRVLEVRKVGEAEARPDDDFVWQEKTVVALKPHPKLTRNQQAVVARDYRMTKNELRVEVRLALLYYFLRRLELNFEEEKRDPREQHVVLANGAEVREALARAQYRDTQ